MSSNPARLSFLAPVALRRLRGLLDRLGLLISSACILHCVAVPLLLLLVPPVGLSLVRHESTLHWGLFSLAFLVSVSAFVWNQARDTWVLLAGFTGLAALYLGVARVFGPAPEVPLTLCGAGLLAFAHFRNWRRGRLPAS